MGNNFPKKEIGITGDGNIIGNNSQVQITKGEVIYQIFSQNTALSNFIRIKQFQGLVNERAKDFVGRNFVFEAIHRLIRSPNFPSGYITIQGEPGIGKTSLLAYLVQQHGYLHHFNIASQNIGSVRDFLGNVCAQLIVSCKLNYPTLPPEATQDSGFLSQLLHEASAKLQKTPLIILVDALDEAENISLAPGANHLYLPQSLPQGVYFIVTMRERAEYQLVVDRRQNIYLKDNDPKNLEDVKRYIDIYLKNHQKQFENRVAEWGISMSGFIEVLTEKSQGNFMYLVHVLGNILDGRITPKNINNINQLPSGLLAYYQRHWRMMRSNNKELFDKFYEPVICMLATVREPVSISQLAEWTSIPPQNIKVVIQEWREFLNTEESQDNITLYHVYHASFQDFLKEEVGLSNFHSIITRDALGKIK